MRCPNGYIQKPAKSGICVKKPASASVTQKKKRCPKGTRKNKSGDCQKIDKQNLYKKKSHSPKSIMIAKLYNVANDIFPGWDYFIPYKYHNRKDKMIQKYVDKESKFNPGDILFVGSTNESGPYQNAFVIINNDRKVIGYKDVGVDLPLIYRHVIPEKISYKTLIHEEFNKLTQATPYNDKFGYNDEYEFGIEFFGVFDQDINENLLQSVIAHYKDKGIY